MPTLTLTEAFSDIADAIRAKNGSSDTYTPAAMPTAIAAITPKLQSKNATPSESSQTISPDSSYEGLASVTVGAISSTYVGSGIARKSSTDLTASGATVNVPAGYYASAASKSVATVAQATPTVSIDGDGLITATATQTAGYVAAGTETDTLQLTKRTSTDLTASGATVSVPAGYYPSAASKSVTSTTQATPSISVNTTTGVITATHTQTAGYVTAGTKTATENLSTVAGTTITPTETAQTAVAANKYTLGAINVAAISSTYVGSDITVDPTPTASGATVTIPEGYYSEETTKSVTTTTHPDPTVSVNTTTGLITASHAQTAGYVSAGTTTKTQQLLTNSGGTYTAEDLDGMVSPAILIAAGTMLTGNLSIDSTDGYVSSSIPRKTSTDLTASGATVTVPAGYYSSQATKSVTTMSLPTSTSSSATSGYTSKATIGRSTSDQYINIPTGYNSAGAYYKVSAVANGSVTAPSSISGSSATVTTGTNTITLTKTVSVTPSVTTAGYVSSGTAGNSSVSLTASVTTKAAATITPGTTNQTIASGTYLTGTQTISGDSDLTAANIKKGVQIFNVTGTYTSDATAEAGDIVSGETAYVDGSKITGSLVINNYYTGSTAPSSSLGSNGDIYFQS